MFTLAIYCYLIQMKFCSPKRRFILELCCRAKVPYWLFVHFFFELSQKSFSGSNFSAASDNFWRSEIFRFFLLLFDFLLDRWFPFTLQKQLLLVDSLGLDVLMTYAFPCRISRPARCTPDIPLGDLRMGNCIQWFQSSSCSKNARWKHTQSPKPTFSCFLTT